MTVLLRASRPDFELWVCGSPSPEWFEWLRTTDHPLTPAQQAWRDAELADDLEGD